MITDAATTHTSSKPHVDLSCYSVFICTAGHENVNNFDRLSQDAPFRAQRSIWHRRASCWLHSEALGSRLLAGRDLDEGYSGPYLTLLPPQANTMAGHQRVRKILPEQRSAGEDSEDEHGFHHREEDRTRPPRPDLGGEETWKRGNILIFGPRSPNESKL